MLRRGLLIPEKALGYERLDQQINQDEDERRRDQPADDGVGEGPGELACGCHPVIKEDSAELFEAERKWIRREKPLAKSQKWNDKDELERPHDPVDHLHNRLVETTSQRRQSVQGSGKTHDGKNPNRERRGHSRGSVFRIEPIRQLTL